MHPEMHSCTGQILDPEEVEPLATKKPLFLWLSQPTSSVGDLALIESWSQHHQVGLYVSSLTSSFALVISSN